MSNEMPCLSAEKQLYGLIESFRVEVKEEIKSILVCNKVDYVEDVIFVLPAGQAARWKLLTSQEDANCPKQSILQVYTGILNFLLAGEVCISHHLHVMFGHSLNPPTTFLTCPFQLFFPHFSDLLEEQFQDLSAALEVTDIGELESLKMEERSG